VGKTGNIIRYCAGAAAGVGDGSLVVFGVGLTAAECATAGGFSLFCWANLVGGRLPAGPFKLFAVAGFRAPCNAIGAVGASNAGVSS
jgi:hypothetical protein